MASYKDYINEARLPHIWCSGCGNGIVFSAVLRAIAEMEIPKEKVVIISGSGCLARCATYPDTHTIKMLHGRVLAGATGVKLAAPDTKVFCLMGDGDGSTIGGNHLIHAARRNLDITAIICNNFNYGMTGGQYSGTTPEGSITATSRYGVVEDGFDLCALVAACGAPYAARTTTYDVNNLKKYIIEATQKKGFGFVEALAACPAHYGKNNKMGSVPEMMKQINRMCVPVSKAASMSPEELKGKFITGRIINRDDLEDYSTKYDRLREKALLQKPELTQELLSTISL